MLSLWTMLIECLFLAILTTAGIDSHSFELDIVLILIFSLAYNVEVCGKSNTRVMAAPFLIGYFFRVALLFFDLYGRSIFVLPNSGADSEVFFRNAVSYAEGLSYIDWPYVIVLGNIMRFLGKSRIFVQFLNLIYSVVTLHITHKILTELDLPLRYHRNIMYVVAVIPNFAILSVILLRESAIIMLLAFSLLFFLRWWKYKSNKAFILAIAFSLFASWFHSGVVSAAIGYAIIYVFYSRSRLRLRLSIKSIFLLLFFVSVFVFLFVKYRDVFFVHLKNLASIDDIANTRVDGGSTYGNIVGDSSSFISMIIHTPLRMVYFLFSPFPWDWRGISDIIAFMFNSLFYFYVIIKALYFVMHRNAANRSLAVSLLIVALAVLFVFSWGVSNTGAAIRHRDKVIILYVAIWAITLKGNNRAPVISQNVEK